MNSVSSLSYVLQHVPTTMHRQADQLLQERMGIGLAQYKILSQLEERPEVHQRFLSRVLGQTEASISRQIKLLQKKQLIAVVTNPMNRREHVLILSPKGIKLVRAAREAVDNYHGQAFQALSDKEKGQLQRLLNVLHMQYCQSGKPHACDLPWFGQFDQDVV